MRARQAAAAVGLAAVAALAAALSAASPLPPAAEDLDWLRGYGKTTGGETIVYHSPYPDIGSALITRATDGRMSIEWETEPVPAGFRGPRATFVWMSGLATGKGGHRFELAIDGTPALAFTSSADSSRKEWRVSNTAGVALRFQAAIVDQFDELFGFMWLTVPRALIEPGRPLNLKVTGEKAGSRDWFMVFEDGLRRDVSLRAEQALVRRDGGAARVVRVEISHIAPPAGALVSCGPENRMRIGLRTGYNSLEFTVPETGREQSVEVKVAVEGRPALTRTVQLEPVVRRELWLLPHSHVDIGYSDPQPVVEKNHWRYYEEAVRLAERSAGYPEGARFKWNVEQLWAVETYFQQADDARRRRFLDAVRKGWIGLQATLAGELTGLCHPEELLHLTSFARRLAAREGIPVDSAMVTDIPSQSWSLVPALALAGVKYLSSGPNYMPSLPDGGDRIGGALKAWGDRPFYWVSPSGREKVLFWMAGRGYSWFHGLHLGSIGRAPRGRIFDYLKELAERGYPYSMVQVRYTVGGDNGPPDPELADFVRAWNDRYESPRLVIATASEMFREFERRHGRDIPSVRGDFTPYWEDGAASSALETAASRAAAERLVRAGALWAILEPGRYPAERFAEAWRQVLLFNEHTWGAADSVSDPDGANARAQWDHKKSFAAGAERKSRALLDEAVRSRGEAAGARRASFDVVNTLSWPRTDLVIIPKEADRDCSRVEDASGNPVPSQRLSTGELAFVAANVPGLGASRYFVEPGRPESAGGARVEGNRLENDRISSLLDPASGAVRSLRWKAGREIELVETDECPGLGHYLYVSGKDPKAAVGVTETRVRTGEAGPLVASIVAESSAPGVRGLRREVRVIDGLARLEIVLTLDKEKIREKESVHIAFPFRVPGGTVRVDTGWAFIRPESDQISGANRDFFCARDSVDVANGDYGVAWTSLDAPLVEIGALTDETPRRGGVRSWLETCRPSPLLYSYAMNNYWHTNYKADQEGPVTFRYAVEPHLGFDSALTRRMAMEAATPLVPVLSGESPPLPRLPLEIPAGPFVVTALRPAEDGAGWILRLFNAGGRPEDLVLTGSPREEGRVFLSDLDEGRLAPFPARCPVPPFGIVTLRIDR